MTGASKRAFKATCVVLLAAAYLSSATVCFSSSEMVSTPYPSDKFNPSHAGKGLSAPWDAKGAAYGLDLQPPSVTSPAPDVKGQERLDKPRPEKDRGQLLLRLFELGASFPQTLHELAGVFYKRGLERALDQTAAGIADILQDRDSLAGTGFGYELGQGVRLQGVGVFDTNENSGYVGPALRFRPSAGIDLTTGMQVSVSEKSSMELKDFFFAEFRMLF